MKVLIATALLAASAVWSQWHQSGFIGSGEREFSNKFGSQLYARIGNQNDPLNPRVIQSLLPENDPKVGEKVIYRVACLNARLDGYGQHIDQLAASLQSFGKSRASCYANPFCVHKPIYKWFQPNLSYGNL